MADDEPTDYAERTSPMGLYNLADSYRLAGIALTNDQPKGMLFDSPIRQLFFHAAELYLKAFLLRNGVDLDRLQKIGHNLPRLLGEAQKIGLTLDVSYTAAIQKFAKPDRVLHSRYIKTGYRTEMTIRGLGSVVEAIHSAIRAKLRDTGMRVR